MQAPRPAADLLATIVAATRRTVEIRQGREPIASLAHRAERTGSAGRSFLGALTSRPFNVIAECKRRSPSRGVLRANYDPATIAKSYAKAGAVALSVLTEPTFFDGSLDHLAAVRKTVDIPLLRKDFIVSEYQLLEAKAVGADAVLLIVAALRPEELARLMERVAELSLDAVVEVHTSDELRLALDAGARIVGVNNRNLRTLEVDVHASEGLVALMPADVLAISESGLRTSEDVLRLRALGYRAFLIGERFMTADDPGAELQGLLARCTAGDTERTDVRA
jgi:indole-3-glycerol phosphate synthase